MLRRKGVKFKIVIADMCCDKCAKRAEKALSAVKGVVSADVRYSAGFGVIRCFEAPSEEEIKSAVEEAGFSVTSIETME
ncbi:MAG: heavy-metal-associated domain-containing protein [Clostridia bacterium]|nr:heavy-metal-associated domain-containing protein [Clostridia bacterium]